MIHETVSGILRDDTRAAAVLADLEAAGFDEKDILVLLPSQGVSPPPRPARPLPEALARLSPMGAALGGLLGLFSGITAIAVAWMGPFTEHVPMLATAIGTTALGAAAGAHLGTGVLRLVTDERARRARDPSLLLSVYAESPSEVDAAKRIFTTHAATQVAVERAARIH